MESTHPESRSKQQVWGLAKHSGAITITLTFCEWNKSALIRQKTHAFEFAPNLMNILLCIGNYSSAVWKSFEGNEDFAGKSGIEKTTMVFVESENIIIYECSTYTVQWNSMFWHYLVCVLKFYDNTWRIRLVYKPKNWLNSIRRKLPLYLFKTLRCPHWCSSLLTM